MSMNVLMGVGAAAGVVGTVLGSVAIGLDAPSVKREQNTIKAAGSVDMKGHGLQGIDKINGFQWNDLVVAQEPAVSTAGGALRHGIDMRGNNVINASHLNGTSAADMENALANTVRLVTNNGDATIDGSLTATDVTFRGTYNGLSLDHWQNAIRRTHLSAISSSALLRTGLVGVSPAGATRVVASQSFLYTSTNDRKAPLTDPFTWADSETDYGSVASTIVTNGTLMVVAIATDGTSSRVSTDGGNTFGTATTRTFGTITNSYDYLAFSRRVLVGTANHLLHSEDGVTFTRLTDSLTSTQRANIVQNPTTGTMIAGGSFGLWRRESLATNAWTPILAVPNISTAAVTYNPTAKLWLAFNIFRQCYVSADDGVTWTQRTMRVPQGIIPAHATWLPSNHVVLVTGTNETNFYDATATFDGHTYVVMRGHENPLAVASAAVETNSFVCWTNGTAGAESANNGRIIEF